MKATKWMAVSSLVIASGAWAGSAVAADRVAPLAIYTGISYDGSTLRVNRPGKDVKLPFSFKCDRGTPITLGQWDYPNFDAYLADNVGPGVH